mgnify:CR=1 FL=1
MPHASPIPHHTYTPHPTADDHASDLCLSLTVTLTQTLILTLILTLISLFHTRGVMETHGIHLPRSGFDPRRVHLVLPLCAQPWIKAGVETEFTIQHSVGLLQFEPVRVDSRPGRLGISLCWSSKLEGEGI